MRLMLVVLGLLTIGTASADARDSQIKQKLQHSTHVLTFFDNHEWLMAPRKAKCAEVPWTKSCKIARTLVERHSQRVETLKHKLWTTIPYTNDWRTSVQLTQRLYPGTSDWLLFISAREGGYGPFVMNHAGSGAGGWLQFMSGTFYAYVDDARKDAERRGFDIPASVWTWTHPLGQALTGAYMRYSGRDGCHWCLG